MKTEIMINELQAAGLCAGEGHELTDKGREWLRQLEELANRQRGEEWAIDLVNSINAINR